MNKRSARLTRALAATAILAVGVALSGCSSSGAGAASDRPAGVIHVAIYGDTANKVEQQIADTFNKTSKIKVVLDKIPGANYQQKLQTIISTKSAPDVFFNWGGGSIAQFVNAGLLLPLDGFIAQDPKLKSSFLPSVFNSASMGGHDYGIPMRGTQPVMLFSNKQVLAKYNITPPTTWDELLADVTTLKAAGITPIALGGADQWPTLMWYEYVYDRVAGPQLFDKALAGDKSQWTSDASMTALKDIKQLIDAGAFGTNFDSVKFTDGGSPKLLRTGKAAFELMGSWNYSTQQAADPAFAAKDLGYSAFPSIAGGAGNQTDLAGNTNNFYSVIKATRYPNTVRDFLKLMYSDEFVKAQLAIGNLPTTTNTVNFLSTAASPDYATFQYNLVKDANSFQLSWDQAYPQTASTAMHTAVEGYFAGRLDAAGFAAAMQALPIK
ncbi:ABC transporter substrate-binding protein [Galbitalea soli]|uniref:Extracellular solute-binding protein n=1 Tax=Galbitalea soli TaxID=1268042 RepID=A0A7C9PPK4_9MICO|nr:extracellular solute-binding protein [Galbitalea soli]NEM92412.1 extracellular solute-binding protein [Galbitalea soli]NYJ29446.1 xylobiose transport system substrate-binding protein [Galbitalea soli]